MLSSYDYLRVLDSLGIEFFTGVPDSLLKGLCNAIENAVDSRRHVVAANEGNAVALAAGYYLSSRRLAMVYLQNSGLGNAVNPLVSLADKGVYSIPMLLVIGWRGEPGVRDEPQHVKQGRITLPLLDVLGVPYWVLPSDDIANAQACTAEAVDYAIENSCPAAIVVKDHSFDAVDRGQSDDELELRREDVVEYVARVLLSTDVVVSTTGKASRELYEIRNKYGDGHQCDFLTVGSMGHASQIALGIALAHTSRTVVCLDGDGAAIMHLGGLATIGQQGPSRFLHVVINNGAHESVGGQPTAGFHISFSKIATACGYRTVRSVSTLNELAEGWRCCYSGQHPSFLEVRTTIGSRSNLARPTETPLENRNAFMRFLEA